MSYINTVVVTILHPLSACDITDYSTRLDYTPIHPTTPLNAHTHSLSTVAMGYMMSVSSTCISANQQSRGGVPLYGFV